MKILITGATGFIGSHLAESLKRDGHDVRCLHLKGDNTGFLKELGCELVEGDLRDRNSLDKAVRGAEIVYHLAALSRYDATLGDEDYYCMNVEATRVLLQLGRTHGIRTFIYVSSIEGRGISQDGKPLTENSPSHPRNIYGKTKFQGEEVCRGFFRRYHMDVRIAIPPTTYGPREYLILQRIFRPVSRGFFILFGKGEALIEFCYIKNQIDGIKRILEKGRAGESYIISDERPYAFREVIEEMARQMNKKVFLLKIPYWAAWTVAVFFELSSRIFKFYPFYVKETGRPPLSRPTLQWAVKSAVFCDIAKAKRELGYKPPFSLSHGLSETIQWYRENGLL
ncbi:MAG: NAD-dependent epimerase/dehydratase family protein [Candidatus Aureabacteria bacterium]|nr:NAD-dependent epimerase/dehydratase family protein [Candidatus Auribacterota bacterium]